MLDYLRLLFKPSQENNFCPKIIGSGALFVYAVLAILVFIAISPLLEVKITRLLANLTQDLIVEEVNPIREENNLLELKVSEKLSLAAQAKAKDMIERDYFSHTSPNGKKPWAWIEEVNYNYSAAGENLAIDCSDPIVLVKAWMQSPLHAKNIINGYFTDVGIGIAKGEFKGRQTTVVVMFLGREILKYPQAALTVEGPKIISQTEIIAPSNKPAFIEKKEKNNFGRDIIFSTSQKGVEVGQKGVLKTIQNTEAKIFLINKFPFIMRLVLTIFFNILILFSLFSYFLKKKGYLARVSNALFLLFLLFFIWFPEIF